MRYTANALFACVHALLCILGVIACVGSIGATGYICHAVVNTNFHPTPFLAFAIVGGVFAFGGYYLAVVSFQSCVDYVNDLRDELDKARRHTKRRRAYIKARTL